jgi:hypothetical protein
MMRKSLIAGRAAFLLLGNLAIVTHPRRSTQGSSLIHGVGVTSNSDHQQ